MEDTLIFIFKWFVMLPICIGILLTPLYLLVAFIIAICGVFRHPSHS